jgi:hypothetical protein
MQVAVIGGQRLVAKATRRGHHVTGFLVTCQASQGKDPL